MRMVFAQAVADDARAFAVRLVGRKTQLVHGEEYAALNGLEAVLNAGQRALEYDVLGIGDHGIVHDLFHRALDEHLVFRRDWGLSFSGHYLRSSVSMRPTNVSRRLKSA